MALKVIGAGLGRTGTLSLKTALEQLGFSPCHHMVEVFAHPEQRDFWLKASNGEITNWEELFAAYQASVDWPSCHFYRELATFYPDAKVILSERDPEKWYESFSNTILIVMQQMMTAPDEDVRKSNRFVEQIIARDTFNFDFSKENALKAYRAHNKAVRENIPASRLLVFDASQGWGPLCEFLGVKVPATPYPRTNSREEFFAHTLPQQPAN